jgi:hypothetical protein
MVSRLLKLVNDCTWWGRDEGNCIISFRFNCSLAAFVRVTRDPESKLLSLMPQWWTATCYKHQQTRSRGGWTWEKKRIHNSINKISNIRIHLFCLPRRLGKTKVFFSSPFRVYQSLSPHSVLSQVSQLFTWKSISVLKPSSDSISHCCRLRCLHLLALHFSLTSSWARQFAFFDIHFHLITFRWHSVPFVVWHSFRLSTLFPGSLLCQWVDMSVNKSIFHSLDSLVGRTVMSSEIEKLLSPRLEEERSWLGAVKTSIVAFPRNKGDSQPTATRNVSLLCRLPSAISWMLFHLSDF